MAESRNLWEIYSYRTRHTPGSEINLHRSLHLGWDEETGQKVIGLSCEDRDALENKLQCAERAELAYVEKLQGYMDDWGELAGETALLRRALEISGLIKTPAPNTGNIWRTERLSHRSTLSEISNETFKLWVYTDTDLYRVQVSWYFGANPPKNVTLLGRPTQFTIHGREKFIGRGGADAYISGLKREYGKYFTELRPPVPADAHKCFTHEGIPLPGYTFTDESIPCTQGQVTGMPWEVNE